MTPRAGRRHTVMQDLHGLQTTYCPVFCGAPHMQQHGLEIEGPSMSDGLGMWM